MSFHAKIARRLKRTLGIITLHFALDDCKRLRCLSKICLGQTELLLYEMENHRKIIEKRQSCNLCLGHYERHNNNNLRGHID